jgi:hypothetical protein
VSKTTCLSGISRRPVIKGRPLIPGINLGVAYKFFTPNITPVKVIRIKIDFLDIKK